MPAKDQMVQYQTMREGVRQVGAETFENLPFSEYAKVMDKIKNGRSHVFYDTMRLEAGTPLLRSRTILFNKGRNEESRTANVGTPIIKTAFDTNMIEGGELAFGEYAIIEAIAAHIILPVRANTTDVDNEPANPAPAVEAANTYSASNLMNALVHGINLTFIRGELEQERGLLVQFPSPFGLSGSFGGDADEGFVQNTVAGRAAHLDQVKVLRPNENFAVALDALSDSLAIPVDTNIRIMLIGKRFGQVG